MQKICHWKVFARSPMLCRACGIRNFCLNKNIQTSTGGQVRWAQNTSMRLCHGRLAHGLIDQQTISLPPKTRQKHEFLKSTHSFLASRGSAVWTLGKRTDRSSKPLSPHQSSAGNEQRGLPFARTHFLVLTRLLVKQSSVEKK